MWRYMVLGLLVAGPAIAGQPVARSVVCPPNLDYCYYVNKPIEPSIRHEDATAGIERTLRCMNGVNNSGYSAGSPAWQAAVDRCNQMLPYR